MAPHMAAGGTEHEEYADHEVQVIYSRAVAGGGTGANANIDHFPQYEPVSDRGLDSDELAELVGMKRVASVYIQAEDAQSQTELGRTTMEVGLGINLSENEFAEQSAAGAGGQKDPDYDGVGLVAVNNYAEPGVLDSITPTSISAGAEPSTADTITAGSAGQTLERETYFADALGSGPFVDRTDDLVIHIENEKENLTAAAIVEVAYILYWRVHEMPEGRASFARP